MNRSIDFTRITSTLAFIVSGWIAGLIVPVHCQEPQGLAPRGKAQLTTPTWVPTGNLNQARVGHTATLLPSGKVLVVGGIGVDPYPQNGLDTAELYDPTTGTWTFTGRMNAAKSGHTATLLADGQVLVVGQATSATAGAELYDPSTGTWRLTSSGTGIWRDHTATLLETGNVLVAGGWVQDFIYRSAALYDPAAGSWSSTGSLITGRETSHQATLLKDGRVLVTGGTRDPDFAFGLPYAELYDSGAGTWSHAADLNTPRLGHSATLLLDGKVLVAGGDSLQLIDQYPAGPAPPNNSAELFDPVTANWSYASSLGAGHSGHSATLLPNGEVLVVGGYTVTAPGPGAVIKSSERYDPSGAVWRKTGDLNVARSGHTATLLPNGKVLVAGGVSPDGILDSAELYGLADPPGTIGPGFTGAWYDPAQSGHGIFVQVLSDQRFYAAWFAFNPAGTQQAWFTGVGTYSGDTATITTVEMPTGGRWIPNFDPSQIVRNAWGTLTFTFIDCNHGRVDFNSVQGYGTGSMNLTRLTLPAGLKCL